MEGVSNFFLRVQKLLDHLYFDLQSGAGGGDGSGEGFLGGDGE